MTLNSAVAPHTSDDEKINEKDVHSVQVVGLPADVELVPGNAAFDIDTDAKDTRVDVHTNLYDGVHRRMESRHMQMFALAGVIGTGLFLGSGKAIAHGGPAGTFLAYVVVGSIIWSTSESRLVFLCPVLPYSENIPKVYQHNRDMLCASED
jgi:amino acid permease